MDAKILAAVLVSLAAVFAGADGGMFSTQDVRNLQQDVGLEAPSTNSLPSKIPIISDLLKKPKPTNSVKAEIVLHGEESFRIKKAGLKASNLTQINAKNMKINSDRDIKFTGFSGKIKLGNHTELDGSATGLQTSKVNITAALALDTAIDSKKIKVENTSRTEFKFSKGSTSIQGSKSDLDTTNTSLYINSFTGNVTIHPEEKKLVIDGKVDKLEAGQYSLEG